MPKWIRIDVSDALHQALRVRAAQEGVTMKELVIRFLKEGLARKESEDA